MNRKLQVLVGVLALAVIGVCSLLLVGKIRVRERLWYQEPHDVQTPTGISYVIQLEETVLGRADAGYIVIVYARVQNPNPVELELPRQWFVLASQEKEYYLPSTTGTQTETIRLGPREIAEREMFSYTVGEKAMAGALLLQFGKDFWVPLKNDQPFAEPLKSGEFRTFRRLEW